MTVVSHGFPNLLVVVMLKIAEAIEPSFDAMLEGRKSEALGEALEVQIPKKLCLVIPFSSFLGCSWLPDQCVSVPSFSLVAYASRDFHDFHDCKGNCSRVARQSCGLSMPQRQLLGWRDGFGSHTEKWRVDLVILNCTRSTPTVQMRWR